MSFSRKTTIQHEKILYILLQCREDLIAAGLNAILAQLLLIFVMSRYWKEWQWCYLCSPAAWLILQFLSIAMCHHQNQGGLEGHQTPKMRWSCFFSFCRAQGVLCTGFSSQQAQFSARRWCKWSFKQPLNFWRSPEVYCPFSIVCIRLIS